MSTQTDKVRQKKCPECKKRIDLPNYDIHLQRCIEARTQQSSSSSVSNVSLQNGERAKGKRKAAQIVEYFPCHLCGYKQTMLELDSHPKSCPNKEVNCPNCHLIFPSNILPAHKQACNRLIQPQRPPAVVPKPQQVISHSVHPNLPNNQDKQLVVNKQTGQQNLYGKANQPASNQISYQMNLPPVPKPEIFPHQQNFQISNNTKNMQVKQQKVSKETKVITQANHQVKSISQKLEKNNVEAQKKGSSSQALPNHKIQPIKPIQPSQPIANNAIIAPKPTTTTNPFKNGESAPVNPFIGNQNNRASNYKDASSPQLFNLTQLKQKPIQNSSKITSSVHVTSKDISSKDIKNTAPSNNAAKINQTIPDVVLIKNESSNIPSKPSNPSVSNQNIPRNPQSNPQVVSSSQNVSLANPSQNLTRNPQSNPQVNTTQNIPRNPQPHPQISTTQNIPRNPQPQSQASITQNNPRIPQANSSANPSRNIPVPHPSLNTSTNPRPPTSTSSSNSSSSYNISSLTIQSQNTSYSHSHSLRSIFDTSSSIPYRQLVQMVNRQRAPIQVVGPARTILARIRQTFSDVQLEQYRNLVIDRNLMELLSSRISDRNAVGLSDSQIRMMPQVLFTTQMTKGEIESCSICVVQFQKNDRLKNFRCRHLYHSKCISEWLKINKLCPLCKIDLSENIPLEYRKPTIQRSRQNYIRSLIGAIFPYDSDSDEDDYDYD